MSMSNETSPCLILNRKIGLDIEKNIVKALEIEKGLIENKEIPIRYYNYSYIKDLLEQKYSQRVSHRKTGDGSLFHVQNILFCENPVNPDNRHNELLSSSFKYLKIPVCICERTQGYQEYQ